MAAGREVGLGRLDPCQRISGGCPRRSTEERASPQDRMRLPQRDHHSGEPEEARRSRLSSDQSTQLIGLSWHQALLLPFWVRRNSSPAQDHRHALRNQERRHQVAHLRSRSRSTAGSSVGPSTPQFQLQLASLPSRFPSPLASLCLWL